MIKKIPYLEFEPHATLIAIRTSRIIFLFQYLAYDSCVSEHSVNYSGRLPVTSNSPLKGAVRGKLTVSHPSYSFNTNMQVHSVTYQRQ